MSTVASTDIIAYNTQQTGISHHKTESKKMVKWQCMRVLGELVPPPLPKQSNVGHAFVYVHL
jgi:hypothetical protein